MVARRRERFARLPPSEGKWGDLQGRSRDRAPLPGGCSPRGGGTGIHSPGRACAPIHYAAGRLRQGVTGYARMASRWSGSIGFAATRLSRARSDERGSLGRNRGAAPIESVHAEGARAKQTTRSPSPSRRKKCRPPFGLRLAFSFMAFAGDARIRARRATRRAAFPCRVAGSCPAASARRRSFRPADTSDSRRCDRQTARRWRVRGAC